MGLSRASSKSASIRKRNEVDEGGSKNRSKSKAGIGIRQARPESMGKKYNGMDAAKRRDWVGCNHLSAHHPMPVSECLAPPKKLVLA